jgi:hypothetical protein
VGTVANLSVKIGANTQDFTKGLQGVQSEVQSTGAKIGAIFASAGVGVLAGQMSQLVGQVSNVTGHLADLAAKSGLSAEAVQELDFVAKQSGSSFDSISQAIALMGNRLVEGDKGAVQALGVLNLNLREMQALSPDQAFQRIAAAIAQIPDPMQRSKLAMDVFGRSGATLLPVLTSNIGQLREQARSMGLVMSNEVVAAGDAVGDSWEQTRFKAQALMAQALIPMMGVFTSLPGPMQSVLGVTYQLAPTLGAMATTGLAMKLALAGTSITAVGAAIAFGQVALAIGAIWAAWKIGNFETVKNGIASWALSGTDGIAVTYRWIAGLERLNPEQAKAAVAANATASAALKQAGATGSATGATSALEAEMRKQSAETQKAIEAAMGEEKALQKSEAAKRKAAQAAEELAKKQAQQAAEYRSFLNFIGEREIEDHKRALEAKEKADSDYRAYQNDLGIQELKDIEAANAAKTKSDAEWRAYQNEAGVRMMEAEAELMRQKTARWTEFKDHANQVIGNISQTMSDNFAGMLTGATGFKEGFVNIWQSIKQGLLSILSEILNQFIHGFLKGMLGALTGSSGSFGQAFAGLFGGGGGGGIPGIADIGGGLLGKIPGLGGLFGGGAAAGSGLLGASAAPSLGSLLGAAPGAAAGGAAAGGGLGATIGALATNPFTIGAAAILGLWASGGFDNSPGDFSRGIWERMYQQNGVAASELPEWVTTNDDGSSTGYGSPSVSLTVNAIDAQSVNEFVQSGAFTNAFIDALRLNRNGILTASQDLIAVEG